jgi:hypothetical protein
MPILDKAIKQPAMVTNGRQFQEIFPTGPEPAAQREAGAVRLTIEQKPLGP